jgi:hypothetical protein
LLAPLFIQFYYCPLCEKSKHIFECCLLVVTYLPNIPQTQCNLRHLEGKKATSIQLCNKPLFQLQLAPAIVAIPSFAMCLPTDGSDAQPRNDNPDH